VPNVYAYIQGGHPGMDNAGVSNAGVIAGPDHLLVIDTLAAPIHTKAFMATARQATGGKPFGRVVNTHHHSDHTTGNCFFLPAEIVGHDYCRRTVIAGGVPNLNRRPASWKVDEHELRLAPPVTTFTDRMVYHYGDLLVECSFVGPAHTYGDVMVHLPQHRILFAGDVAFFYVQPVSFGHTTKWIELLETIDRMDVETIVPGHGPIGTKKDLKELHEYLSLIKREARKKYDAGVSPGRAAAEIDLGRFQTWPNPERIVGTVVRLYAEFGGTIGPEVGGDVSSKATQEFNALRKGESR
jgi:cyclase